MLTVLPGFVETEGFPQRGRLRGLSYRAVVGPELVADAHRRRESSAAAARLFVPRWYRIFALAQALAPSVVARLAARTR